MKKLRSAKQFLEELSKTPIVSAVCSKLNLSRQTIYRWKKEDPEFAENYEECLKRGAENINDLAESKMIGAINRSEPWAIKYWLDNNKKNYVRPRPKFFLSDLIRKEDMDKINIQMINCGEKPTPILVRFIDGLSRDKDGDEK